MFFVHFHMQQMRSSDASQSTQCDLQLVKCMWVALNSDTLRLHKSLLYHSQDLPAGSMVKNPPANAADVGSIPELGRFPGEVKATHSSIPAWEIPWTEEPGGLQSMGLPKSQT